MTNYRPSRGKLDIIIIQLQSLQIYFLESILFVTGVELVGFSFYFYLPPRQSLSVRQPREARRYFICIQVKNKDKLEAEFIKLYLNTNLDRMFPTLASKCVKFA